MRSVNSAAVAAAGPVDDMSLFHDLAGNVDYWPFSKKLEAIVAASVTRA
jgi:hypothetical protein